MASISYPELTITNYAIQNKKNILWKIVKTSIFANLSCKICPLKHQDFKVGASIHPHSTF